MRTGSSDISRRPPSRRTVPSLALLVLAVLCALGSLPGGAPAQDLQVQLRDKQAELDAVEERKADLSASIAEQNRQVNELIGEVAEIRDRAAAVQAKLAAKQAQLERAQARLARQRGHLQDLRRRLQRALGVLREELVRIYQAGDPDTLSVVLDSASWSDVIAQGEYLDAFENHLETAVDRVRGLRDQTQRVVERMRAARDQLTAARDAIAAKEREIARVRADLELRHAEFVALRGARQRQLDDLAGRQSALENNLASITDQLYTGSSGPAPAAPAPLAPGDQATLLSDGQAAAPASAPEAVKAVIAGANQIADTPYLWGGGHGSFESSGYDCSGAISFALHSGGLLDSPLDSTGFTTWGFPGAGRWITVYGNAGHAYAVIAGLRWDTSGGAGPRWHSDAASSAGFIARHPDGY